MKRIRYCLLLLLYLFITSCSVENEYIVKRESELKIKKVTLKQLKMKKSAFDVFREAVTSNNPLQRVVYSQEYGVYYDVDNITHIQKGNFESFTIPVIKQENDTLMKNLVLYRKSDEQPFGVKLYGYNLSEEEMARVRNQEFIDLREKAFEEIQNQTYTTSVSWIDGSGCLVTMTIDYFPGMCSEGLHSYGDSSCQLTGNQAAGPGQIVIKYYYSFCNNGSQTGGGPVAPPAGPGPGSGPGSDPGSSNPIPTAPTPDDDEIEDEIITTPQPPGILPDDEQDDPEEPDCDITADQLLILFPDMTEERRNTLSDFINSYGKELGMDTKEKVCHFLAQTGAETGGFDTFNATENLNYSASRLVEVWPSKFSFTNPELKNPYNYDNDSEKLANFAYCCKSGNGNEASGDGWRYRGRGCIQLTWKNNYIAYEDYLEEIGLEWTYDGPEDVANVETHSILSAMHFFKVNVLDKITIDANTASNTVTSRINPGANKVMKTERSDNYTAALAAITCN